MATVILGGLGAGIGSVFGGGLGAKVGWSVGTLLGGIIDQSGSQQAQSRGRLEDLRITGSSYGVVIPQIWGLAKVGANIVFALPLVESSTSSGGKGGASQPTVRTYHYSASFAVMWCRGPITRIRRIWAEDRLIYDYSNTSIAAPCASLTNYLGTETQVADALVSSSQPSGQAPAFRGSAYTVFDSLNLDTWGNRIPALTAEVENNEGVQRAVLATSGLQAFYQFEVEPGRLADSGPNAWSLIDSVGTSVQTDGRWGLYGYKGTGSVRTNRTIGSQLQLQGPYVSVEAWFRWLGTTSGSNTFGYRNPSTAETPGRLTVSSDGAGNTIVRYRVFTNASGVQDLFNYSFVADLNWHHAVVTYDTTDGAKLYVDGVLVSSITSPVTVLTITASASNLINIDGGDFVLDNLALYNSILTAADVTNRWRAGQTVATVADVLGDCFAQSGLSAAQFDLSGAYVPLHGGYQLAQRTEARSAIESLLMINLLDVAEWDGKIHVVARGGASAVTVPLNDLGAETWSGSPASAGRIQTKRIQDWDLPRRLDLTYYTAIPSAVNDSYNVTLTGASSGQWKLSVSGVSTPGQNTNISAATVQGNLENLSTVGVGNVSVTGANGGPFTITFQGALGAGPVDFKADRGTINGTLTVVQNNIANYSQALQSATRHTKTWSSNLLTISTPAVLDDNFARQQTEKLLYDHWLQKESFTFQLPPAYWVYTPSDVMQVPVGNSTARVRVTSQDIGLFGPTQFQATLDSTVHLTQSVAAATVTYTPPTKQGTSTALLAFSTNALVDADTTSSGFYWGVAGAVAGEEWPGATLYWSRDSGANYQSLASTIEAVNYGTCSTILPDPPALVGDENWDTVSTVDVTMTSGVPLTDSDSNVLNGTNAAMVGNEIIQYATVTPLGGNSYRLSRLLRGRRGTDFYMTGHIASESFVMLQTGLVRHQVCDESLRGKTVLLKAVTSGGSLGAVSPTSLLITGNEWRCYSPTYVKGTRNGGNDLTVTWIARTRSGGEMVDGGDVNDADAPDTFDVEFLASPGGAVVRTVSGLTSATTLYTAAQQTSDGLVPGNPVSLVVYQIGRYLRGWPENSTV
jgi:hypothetical protein